VEFSPEAIAVHCEGKVVYANPAGLDLIGATSPEQVIGKPLLSFVHPDYHKIVLDRTSDAMSNGSPLASLEEKLLRLDGRPIDVEVTSMLMIYDGKNAIQVIMRDISARKQVEAGVQRQLLELTVLNSVASAEVGATDVDELIASVTSIISQTLYKDNCGVLLVDHKTQIWTPHPSYHGSRRETLSLRHPLNEGIIGRVARTGLIVRSGNIQSEPEYFETTSGVRSEISVPIVLNGQVYGVLNVESLQEDAFDERDERLLKTISESMVVALEKIRRHTRPLPPLRDDPGLLAEIRSLRQCLDRHKRPGGLQDRRRARPAGGIGLYRQDHPAQLRPGESGEQPAATGPG
jgi:PAS domain S-box-containing protein